jgi:hypothetical protein
MTWLGKWRNQYGSILEIISDSNHRISETFKTTLKDSAFHGQEFPMCGAHQGECIGLSAAGCTPEGAAAKLEKLGCCRAITSGSDTLERVAVSEEAKTARTTLTKTPALL